MDSCDQILVSQPPSDGAINEAIEPVQRVPLAVSLAQPEREFVYIAAQMLLAGVVIDAIDAALEDREVTLGIVSVSIASDVFILRMNDGPMAGKFLAGFPIDAAFVSSKMGSFIDPGLENWPQVSGIHFGHMVGTDAPFALDQRDNRLS